MTEGWWVRSGNVPRRVAEHRAAVTDRRLRLFARACCRRAADLLLDPRSLRAVEEAERFATGRSTGAALAAARRLARRAIRLPLEQTVLVGRYRAAAARAAAPASDPDGGYADACRHASRAAACRPGRPDRDRTAGVGALRARGHAAQAGLLRDIVGDPFRPAAAGPRWRPRPVRPSRTRAGVRTRQARPGSSRGRAARRAATGHPAPPGSAAPPRPSAILP